MFIYYPKIPQISDTQNLYVWFYLRVMRPKDAEEIANSVDPDQTAVWSGSALFAQAYLSENLGSLWHKFLSSYIHKIYAYMTGIGPIYALSGN